MTILEENREASATIQGYMYQFDASILAILDADENATFTIEGIEDIDATMSSVTIHRQFKYISSKRLTNSTLRVAIAPMIGSFLLNDRLTRKTKKYILYGYFKGNPEDIDSLELERLQTILVYHRYFKDHKGNRIKRQRNLQEELQATDQDLRDFCSCFSFRRGEEFETHRSKVIERLTGALKISSEEAESYCYPSALTKIADLARRREKSGRTITRSEFLQKIKPNLALYSAWTLREKGEDEYCRTIKALHFSRLNIANRDRFFIITLPESDSVNEIYNLVNHIITNWSSHDLRKKPNKERYAPIFYFPSLHSPDLIDLKNRLFADDLIFTDGYPFSGASFEIKQLLEPQTNSRPIAARFICDVEALNAALLATKKNKIIIQIYHNRYQDIDLDATQIVVPIRDARMAMKIL